MKLVSILFTAALATLASAQKITRCGNAEPPEELKIALNQAAFKHAIYRNGTSRTVDTYAHVVTTQEKKDEYTEEQVSNQIEVMNQAYDPSGFQFNLLETDFTANDDWAATMQDSPTELEMKKSLHKGTYSNLNLYFLSDIGGCLLGFCYFPLADPNEDDLALDGCVNIAGTLPGANELPDYSLGLTTMHETGHWLGLFHVFQGGCSGKGDYINDTPAQGTATEGCPASADTCPDSPGVDNIHNYMDYSYDECLDSFTRQQGQRMFSLFDQLRSGK